MWSLCEEVSGVLETVETSYCESRLTLPPPHTVVTPRYQTRTKLRALTINIVGGCWSLKQIFYTDQGNRKHFAQTGTDRVIAGFSFYVKFGWS